mgnify:CR=1 FL=1
MAGPHRHGAAAKVLASVAPTVADHFSASNRFTLAVVGSRVSFGLALATAIDSALQNLGKAKAFVSLRKQLDITKGTYKGLPINAAAGELAEHFATAVVEKGYQGLTLLIDEVGSLSSRGAKPLSLASCSSELWKRPLITDPLTGTWFEGYRLPEIQPCPRFSGGTWNAALLTAWSQRMCISGLY